VEEYILKKRIQGSAYATDFMPRLFHSPFTPHPQPLSEGEGWLAHQVESRTGNRKIIGNKSLRELSEDNSLSFGEG
jgi:hypothetical protein